LLPHLRQLGIEIVFSEDLPRFDEATMEWIQKTRTATRFDEALIRWILEARRPTKVPVSEEIKAALQKPFPDGKRTWFTDAMALMEWSHTMFKGAYPSRENPAPLYAPETIVSLRLLADELEAILTQTRIAKTKKLRPRMEAMAAEGKTIDLEISDWSRIILALCAPKVDGESARRHLRKMATGIANQLAEALGIDPPSFSVK
jgi:hypothetical protein